MTTGMSYVAWIWNRMPQFNSGYSPEELLARVKSNHAFLNKTRVWGSTVFLLNPKLQDG